MCDNGEMARGGTSESNLLKTLIKDLEEELKIKANENSVLEAEVRTLQRKLQRRDHEIMKQERELHKLRSVLQQASHMMSRGEDQLLSTIQDAYSMAGQIVFNKKQGVSGKGRSAPQKQNSIHKHSKDFRSKTLIKEAIMDNDFLKNLSTAQVREIVDAMEERNVPKGSYVIREGEIGSNLFVSAEGEFDVIKEGKVLGSLGVGKVFGELAILYNCKRTASIKACSPGKLWSLDRNTFQQIMVSTGIKKFENQVKFLKSVPLLENLPQDAISRMSDVLEVEVYKLGEYIVREGTAGDTFYIIADGDVRVTQNDGNEEKNIRVLSRGEYFGEQALLKTHIRTANVIAASASVECLMLDRDAFFHFVGELEELNEKEYKTTNSNKPELSIVLSQEASDIELENLEVIATLGVGGFGRVELVQTHDSDATYALKCLRKQHIVETQQQEHVFSEKNILLSCDHPFITRLYRTFKDDKYVYMLMEASLGGELWTILRDRGWFDDSTTRFYLACVVQAIEYLHSKGIIYRDLKPENLLLEYVAPEIILNKGHDRAVDFWSMGILMYELLTGTPPFTASDPMKVYNIILRGFDQLDFPRHITRTAVNIMKRFCRDNPVERLGYQKDGISDIRKNRWFQGFDWSGLMERRLEPPVLPIVHSRTDTSNFDKFPRDAAVPANENSGWDKDF